MAIEPNDTRPTQFSNLDPISKMNFVWGRRYYDYLPTAYDDSMTFYEQLAQFIEYLNQTKQLTDQLVDQWEEIKAWIINDGLNAAVVAQMEKFVKDGTFKNLINEHIFDDLNAKIDALNSASPFDVVANESELNSKYPSGAKGTVITDNTGHWWYWNKTKGIWVDGGLYQAVVIANGSVNYPKRTRMGSSGYIIVGKDTQINLTNTDGAKTIAINGRFWITDGSQPVLLQPTTFNLGNGNGNILFDTEDQTIYIEPFGDHPDAKTERSLYLGTWFASDVINLNALDDKVVLNGRYQGIVNYAKRSRMGSTGYIIVGAATKINLSNDGTNKTIAINGRFWITDGSQPALLEPATFNLGSENGNILYDTEDKSIYIEPFGDHPDAKTERSLYLGTWFAGDIVNLNAPNTKFIVNGAVQNSYLPKDTHLNGMVLASDDIIINSSDKTATCNGQINVVIENGYNNGQVELDFNNLDPERANTIYYDPSDNTIKVSNNKDNSGFDKKESMIVVGIVYGVKYNKYIYINTNANVIIDGVVAQQMNGDTELYKTPIACLGDSITAGLVKTGGHYTTKPYPYWISIYFGGATDNIAVSGGSFYGDTEKDFKKQYLDTDFSKYQIATIAFGINDYYNNYSLENVINSLKAGLDKIYKDNPTIRIAGILPQMSWHHDEESLTVTNDENYNLNDLCNELIKVYEEYKIPYFDWRKAPIVNKYNYTKITSDGTHLNDSSYQIMGRRISEFMRLNV